MIIYDHLGSGDFHKVPNMSQTMELNFQQEVVSYHSNLIVTIFFKACTTCVRTLFAEDNMSRNMYTLHIARDRTRYQITWYAYYM